MRGRGNTFRTHAPPPKDVRGVRGYGKGKCQRTGKVIFPTKKKAIRQMDSTNAAARKVYGHKMIEAAYECPHCGFWHFTSQEQRD